MDSEPAKMVVQDGWAICPRCHKGKLLKIRPDTMTQNLPCKCKRCGQESIANIDMSLSP